MFGQQHQFSFGGNTGNNSYEEMRRKRQMAQQIQSRVGGLGGLGGAIADIGSAFATRHLNKQADKMEEEGRNSVWQAIHNAQHGLPASEDGQPAQGNPYDSVINHPFFESLSPNQKRYAFTQWSRSTPEQRAERAREAELAELQTRQLKQQIALNDQRMNAEPQRPYTKDVNGVLRYIDTGQQVFEGVEPAPEKLSPYQEATLGLAQERNDIARQRNGMTVTTDPNTGQTVVQFGGSRSGRPPTADQSNSAGFFNRMSMSNDILNDLEEQGTSIAGSIAEEIPLVGNFLKSEDRQKYEAAERDFVTAVLRKESGAVISPSEFDTEALKYFPQPGDGPEVIAQKRQLRSIAVQNMQNSSGSAFTASPIYATHQTGMPQEPFSGGEVGRDTVMGWLNE